MYGRLHAHGITHGDVQARHVLFSQHKTGDPSKTEAQISLVDFEAATSPATWSDIVHERSKVEHMVSEV